MKNKNISILVDNGSWILPYATKLEQKMRALGYEAKLVTKSESIGEGWINFILGYTRIISSHVLMKNEHNLVVHESNLPKGRGFAPMSWQILEGKNEIPICLMEAAIEVDTGGIWIRDKIELDGSELCEEWRALQGEKTLALCIRFIKEYDKLKCSPQTGEPTWYERRKPENSQLDLKQSIEEQFDLLRTVDNIRYPAFFEISGCRYIIKVKKANG